MKKIWIIVLIGVIAIIAFSLLTNFSNKQECPEDYSGLLYETANRLNVTIPYNSIKVESERCSVKVPYQQVEMKGSFVDEDGKDHDYYFLMIFGGMAASGQDSYNEICLNVDGQNEISRIERGAQLEYKGISRCKWLSNYP